MAAYTSSSTQKIFKNFKRMAIVIRIMALGFVVFTAVVHFYVRGLKKFDILAESRSANQQYCLSVIRAGMSSKDFALPAGMMVYADNKSCVLQSWWQQSKAKPIFAAYCSQVKIKWLAEKRAEILCVTTLTQPSISIQETKFMDVQLNYKIMTVH